MSRAPDGDRWVVEGEGHKYLIPNHNVVKEGAQARIAVRPEWLDVFVPDQVPSDENALHGTVRDVLYLGETLHVLVRLPSGRDIAVGVRNEGQLTRPLMWKTGQSVAVAWKPGDCQVLEDDA